MSDYVDSLCELRLPVLSVDSILLFTCRETGITTCTSLLNSKAPPEIRYITQLDVEWEIINISERGNTEFKSDFGVCLCCVSFSYCYCCFFSQNLLII